jgi:hypothetical protein
MHRFLFHCERAKRHARYGDVARSARHINRAVRYSRFGAPHEINLDSKLGIRLIGHTGPATVIFRGIEVPCTVAVTDTDIDFIVQGEKRECLYMTLQPRLQAATVHILNVEENSCPLSAGMQHKGAFLLGLTEELCRQVGVHTVSFPEVEAQIVKPREKLKIRERARVREFVAADTRYDAFFGNIASRVSLLLACLARYKKTSTSDKLFELLEFVWAESRASFVEIASLLFPSLDLRHAADRTRQLLPPSILPPFPHCAWMARTIV